MVRRRRTASSLVTTRKGRAGTAKWAFTGERGLVQDPTEYFTMYANFGHAPGAADGAAPIRCKIATMVTPRESGRQLHLGQPHDLQPHEGQ